jgi:hypothetical protein
VLLAGDSDPINVRFFPSQDNVFISSIVDVLNDYSAYPLQLNWNSDFETDINGWRGSSSLTSLQPVRTTTQAFSGAASILVTPNGANNTIGFRTDDFDISGLIGKASYQFTGAVRCADSQYVKIRFQWYDKRRSFIQNDEDVILLAANTWTPFDFIRQAPSEARSASVWVFITDADGNAFVPPASSLIYGDDLRFSPYYDVSTDPTSLATMVRVAGKPGNYYVEEIIRTPERGLEKIEHQYWGGPSATTTFAPEEYFLRWRKYRGAKKFKLELQGGGGAGGGAALTGAGQFSEGGGGGGGGYAYEWFSDEEIPDEVLIVLGRAGRGVTGADGESGWSSSFDGLFGVDGGDGGDVMPATAGPLWANSGGGGSGWDNGTGLPYIQRGQRGTPGWVLNTTIGTSRMSWGGAAGSGSGNINHGSVATSVDSGNSGGTSGSGGGGARNNASKPAKTGAPGGIGWAEVTTYF